MNKIFLMQPRQTGKTTKAIYEFVKDPHNTIFVEHNFNSTELVRDKLSKFCDSKVVNDRVISVNEFLTRKHDRCKNIILDEYMFFDKRDKVYVIVNRIQPENLYIYSTTDKQYSRELFDFVKKHKELNYTWEEVIKRHLDKKGELTKEAEAIQEIDDLYYNFLTDPDTRIIDGMFNPYNKDMSHFKTMLRQQEYEKEILNIYLK